MNAVVLGVGFGVLWQDRLEGRGASSLRDLRIRIGRLSRGPVGAHDDRSERRARADASVHRTIAFLGEGRTVAQKSRAKFEKRQKEQARMDRQKLKREQRAAARERKADDVPAGEAPEAPDDQDGATPVPDES
jgi:hypothetical protein